MKAINIYKPLQYRKEMDTLDENVVKELQKRLTKRDNPLNSFEISGIYSLGFMGGLEARRNICTYDIAYGVGSDGKTYFRKALVRLQGQRKGQRVVSVRHIRNLDFV